MSLHSPRSAYLHSSLLSIHQSTTPRWNFSKDLFHYRAAGFTSIGAWWPKLVRYGEEKAVELVHDFGMKVSSIGWVGSFTGYNGYSITDSLHESFEAIQLASRLNAPVVSVVTGPQNHHIDSHVRRIVRESLQELADFAAPRGITLALRPMPSHDADAWTFLTSLPQTIDFLDSLNHPAVKLDLPTSLLNSVNDLPSLLPALVPLTAIVHLTQLDSPSILPLAESRQPEIGLDGLETLIAAGYQGPVEAQIWSRQLWHAGYTHLINSLSSLLRGINLPHVPSAHSFSR